MNRNPGDVVWRSLLFNSLVVGGVLSFKCDRAFSQITPDNTLGAESSVVNSRDATSESIDGGAVRGQNLFHSFEEFNVGEDRGVYFANPDAVTNILSRVTGNDVSDILGTLGVDGAANLFLINPNGIVFGEGANLDIQGSFTATTADGIEFGEQGFFSAVNPTNSVLVLTISVPLGLQFGSNPGSIINRSFVADITGELVGLQVPDGENITLFGGDITFKRGQATASGGNIEIGGLDAAGEVSFNDDGSLKFPDNVARADISLSNAADVDVTGTGGGNIKINARNLNVEAGEAGFSRIRAGITANSTSTEAQAGNITINATDNVTVDNSAIANNVEDINAVGDAGNINIKTRSLALIKGSYLETSVRGASDSLPGGKGQGGSINIDVDNTLTISGENARGIFADLGTGAEGSAGNIDIQTGNLAIQDGGVITSVTSGDGDSGNIAITADNEISLDDSTIANNVNSNDAVGNAGKIDITTDSLSATNGSGINSLTRGRGDAGDITIQATNAVTFGGVDFNGLASSVEAGGVGDGGNIDIKARSLALTNGGQLEASVREAFDTLPGGKGQGGNINIDVDDTLTISGENSRGILATLGTDADGNAGNIDITTGNLAIQDGGVITSATSGKGDSGNISITADNEISLDDSIIANNVNSNDAVGNAGKIDITTGSLSVTNGGQINSLTRGLGNAGDITIQAIDTIVFEGFNSDELPSSLSTIVENGAVGNGGDINLTAGDIRLRDDGDILTNVFNRTGDGGNINITVHSIIAFDDSDIFTFAADRKGGNINLNTPSYFGENFTRNSLTTEDTNILQNNNRADINATGAVSGSVTIPDVSFIQNSLTELENNSINTDELVANSCVSPVGDRQQGKFIITGGQSLPVRPGDGIPSKYPTGEVRNVPESNHSSWQQGDPIVEPQGAYRLANGKLVLSRECSN